MLPLRKFIANIILITVFALVLTAIITAFLGDLQFGDAKKMEVQFRWQKAEEKYLTAIKLDPANAQYLLGYGDFL